MLVIQSKNKDYDAKVLNIKNKYITTAHYNKFTKNIVADNIKGKKLVDKSAIAEFINNTDLDIKSSTISNKKLN